MGGLRPMTFAGTSDQWKAGSGGPTNPASFVGGSTLNSGQGPAPAQNNPTAGPVPGRAFAPDFQAAQNTALPQQGTAGVPGAYNWMSDQQD